MTFPEGQPSRRIRLWFGPNLIADYCADATTAARYQAAIELRFPGLDTTNDPCEPSRRASHPAPLPSEQLWFLTP